MSEERPMESTTTHNENSGETNQNSSMDNVQGVSSNDGMHVEEKGEQSMVTRRLFFGMPNDKKVIRVNTEASHNASIETVMAKDKPYHILVRSLDDKDVSLRAEVTVMWTCSVNRPQTMIFTKSHSLNYSKNAKWKLRLDAFLPLFENAIVQDSTIALFHIRVSREYEEQEKSFSCIPLPILSGKVVVEGKVNRVIKELLAAHSEFFSILFFGDFKERNEEVVELNEISANTFISLIDSLVTDSYKNDTVEDLMELLDIANRFQVLNVVKKCVDHLLTRDLSEDENFLPQMLLLSDQCRNEELREHILSSFTYPLSISEAFRQVANRISADTSVAIMQCMARCKLQNLNLTNTLEDHKCGQFKAVFTFPEGRIVATINSARFPTASAAVMQLMINHILGQWPAAEFDRFFLKNCQLIWPVIGR